MKEKQKNKKTMYAIIGLIALILITIGVTYAYWLVTKSQTGENIISTGCLDINLSNEKNVITLTNQYPTSDEDGMKLVPYEFTVTNNCKTSVDYQLSLEAIGSETTSINANAIKVALNEDITLLNYNKMVSPTIEDAYEAYQLRSGTLAAASNETTDDTETYKLRIWIDEDASIEEMDKTFKSKISVTVGQGISNPIKQGTLAYDILASYGGQAGIQTTSSKLVETVESAKELEIFFDKVYFATEYTYDKDLGTYELTGDLVLASPSECRSGAKTCGKYTEDDSCLGGKTSTYIYEITDFGTSGDYVTAKKISYKTGFDENPGSGIYKTQDNLGTSYYLRGDISNNYVKFGTWAENSTIEIGEEWVDFETGAAPINIEVSAGSPMYWRIVRINGDGTLRLVYAGTEVNSKTPYIGKVNYNDYELSADKFYGYTYDDGTGNQVDSTIKSFVDNWYETNLKSNYGKYIADGIFCNDRVQTGYVNYEDDDYYDGQYYAAYTRVYWKNAPQLTCSRKEDRYSVSDKIGNGYLSNPVGLLSVDELAMARVSSSANFSGSNYLSVSNVSGSDYTTAYYLMSPARTSIFGIPNMAIASGNGITDEQYGDYFTLTRPVINLKADVVFTGNGTSGSPYEVVMN